MALSIGTVYAALELQDNFSKRIDLAGQAVDRFAGKTAKMADSLQATGTKLTLGLTLPIAGAVAGATKSFLTFEGAMKKAQAAMADGKKTAAQTASEMTILKNAAIEWGQKTSFSAAEAGEALAELGKAGFAASEAAGALPSVLQLAEASSIGLADAASITANTMQTFGHSITDLARDNDILTKAVNSSTIDISDLRETLKYVGPIARTTGTSLAEVSAAAAMLSGAGIKGSMAGTALRETLERLVNPTKKTREEMEAMGISSFVSNGQVMKFVDVVKLLEERLPRLGGSAEQTASLMSAFGDRAGPALAALVSRGSAALVKMQADLEASQGTAKMAADIMMSGLGGALERMKGAAETAAMAVGEALVPAIRLGASLLERFANFMTSTVVPAFRALPEPVQAVAGGLLAVVAAAGPVLVTFGGLLKLLPFLSGGLSVLSGALGFVTGGIVMVDGALMVAVGTLNLVIPGWTLWAGAILGVAAAIITWLGGWGPMWDAIKTAATYVGDRLAPAFLTLWNVLTQLSQPIAFVAEKFAALLAILGGALMTQLQASWDAWKKVGAVIVDVADVIEDLLVIAYEVGRIIGGVVRAKVLEAYETFEMWRGAVVLLAKIVGDHLSGALARARSSVDGVLGPVRALWDALTGFGRTVKDAVVGALSSVIAKLRELAPPIDWLIDKITWLRDNASFSGFKAAVKDVRESLQQGVVDPLGLQGAASKAQTHLDALKASGMASAAAIKSATDDVADAQKRLAVDTGNPFKSFTDGAYKVDTAITSVIPPAAKLRETLSGGRSVGTAAKEASTFLSSFKDSVTELDARIALATKNGATMPTLLREFGEESAEAATKATLWGVAVSASVSKVAKSFTENEAFSSGAGLYPFRDARTDLDAWTSAFTESLKTQAEATKARDKARADGWQANAQVMAQTSDEMFAVITSREVDSLQLRQAAIARDVAKRKAALDVNGANYRQSLAQIAAYEQAALKATAHEWMFRNELTKDGLTQVASVAEARYDAIRNSGVATAQTIAAAFAEMRDAQIAAADAAGFSWTTAIGSIADGMSQLGASLTAFSGGQGKLGTAGKVLSVGGGLAGTLQDQMKKYGEGNRVGIASPLFDPKATKGAKIGAGIGSGVAIAQGAMDIWSATGNSKTRGGAALSGMAAGAKAGAAFGPYGMAIGAGIGLIVGLVRGKAAWAKAQDEITRDYKGLKGVSDETAKAIQENTKKLFKGDRATGNLYALDQIISDGGGLNAANFDGLVGKLRDVFSAVKTGKFTVEQATEVLNKNWKTFADVAVASGKIASQQFIEVGELADKMGITIEGRAEHLKDMLGRFITGIETALVPLAKAWPDALQQWTEGGGTDKIAALVPEFERFGNRVVDAFNAGKKQGLGLTELFDALGPAMDALIPIQEHLTKIGIDAGSETLKRIIAEKQLVDTNRDLVDGAKAYNDMLVAGSFLGLLNADAMRDFGAQGMQTYDRLIAAGFSQGSALAQLKDGIQSSIERYRQLGIPMDENTRKLAEMAAAEGLLGEKGASTNDLLIDGIGALITAVGGELPESFKKAAAAAQEAGAGIAAGIATATADAATKGKTIADGIVAGLTGESGQIDRALATILGTDEFKAFDAWAAAGGHSMDEVSARYAQMIESLRQGSASGAVAILDMWSKGDEMRAFATDGAAAFKLLEKPITDRTGDVVDLIDKMGRIPSYIGTKIVVTETREFEGDSNDREPIYRASGGLVPGGPRGSDSVGAWLTPGEGVVSTRGMARLGASGLSQLNAGGAVTQGATGGGIASGDVKLKLTTSGEKELATIAFKRAPEVARETGAVRR